jgi:spore photoproduct lyase
MEDPSLWEPTFGYSYPDDRSFEAAMKKAYQSKVEFLDRRKHL